MVAAFDADGGADAEAVLCVISDLLDDAVVKQSAIESPVSSIVHGAFWRSCTAKSIKPSVFIERKVRCKVERLFAQPHCRPSVVSVPVQTGRSGCVCRNSPIATRRTLSVASESTKARGTITNGGRIT